MEDLLTGIGGGVVAIFAMFFAIIMMGFVMMFIGTLFMLFAELLMLFIELLFLPFTIIDFLVVLMVSLIWPSSKTGTKQVIHFIASAVLIGTIVAGTAFYLSQELIPSLSAGALLGIVLGGMNAIINRQTLAEFPDLLRKFRSKN